MAPEGIGLRIRRRRQQMGLTLKEASRRAGINSGVLSSIELYYVNRVPSRLPDIAKALETSVSALLGHFDGLDVVGQQAAPSQGATPLMHKLTLTKKGDRPACRP